MAKATIKRGCGQGFTIRGKMFWFDSFAEYEIKSIGDDGVYLLHPEAENYLSFYFADDEVEYDRTHPLAEIRGGGGGKLNYAHPRDFVHGRKALFALLED